MKIIIKLILAALLLGCLLKMPYGYYEFIRWICCVGFIWFAYQEYENKRKALIILLIGAAILFNPIAPIYLKRETWQPIDVTTAILLIIWATIEIIIYLKYGKKESQEKN